MRTGVSVRAEGLFFTLPNSPPPLQVSFSSVQTALDIPEDQVELFVVRAIGAKLLEGKIDQVRERVCVRREEGGERDIQCPHPPRPSDPTHVPLHSPQHCPFCVPPFQYHLLPSSSQVRSAVSVTRCTTPSPLPPLAPSITPPPLPPVSSSQVRSAVSVTRCTMRAFGPAEWKVVRARLATWRESLVAVQV